MHVNSVHECFLRMLPLDWNVKSISDLGIIVGGSTPSRDVERYWKGDIPWVTPGELTSLTSKYLGDTREYITQAGLESCGARLLPVETLLVTSRATIGAVALACRPISTNQGFKSVVFGPGTEPGFYFHLFKRLIPELTRRASGTTFLEISGREFGAVRVPVPPLPEQLRIAEILDTVDEAIRRTEQIIAKLKQIKQGLLHDLLSRGIDENGELRDPERHPGQFKVSPLGQIPRGWIVCRAGELCSSIVPGRDKPDLDGGPLPWITVSDLAELYVSHSLLGLSLSHTAVRKASGRTVPRSAVIMSCVGEFGLTAIASAELVVNQQLHGFVCGDKITPEWLAYFLARRGSYIDSIAQQTTIKYLNKAGCESILIAVPSLDEQLRVANIISTFEETSQAERKEFDKLCLLKNGLMDDLLTGRVRVTKLETAA